MTAPRRPPGEVRLIGGQFKRSKLPVANLPGLRPTPDRVRETLFNWLGQQLDGWRCLDAFAGSGALGFEAASRGASSVLMIEREARLAASLEASKQRLGAAAVQVRRGDALAQMRVLPPQSFELVLLDPPFDAGLAEPALQAAAPLAVAGGYVYLESSSPPAALPAELEPWREGRAGAVHFALLRRRYTAAAIDGSPP